MPAAAVAVNANKKGERQIRIYRQKKVFIYGTEMSINQSKDILICL